MELYPICSFQNATIISLTNNSFYSRIAVLTSDNLITFFSLDPKTQLFTQEIEVPLISIAKTLTKIKFAPPEYGSVLAISDANGTLYLYEETFDKATKTTKNWFLLRKFDFPDQKLNDFKFSPTFQSFCLAMASSFGVLKLYEPSNNLEFNDWDLVYHDISNSNLKGIMSISWCKNPFYPALLAVSFDNDILNSAERRDVQSEILLYINSGDSWKVLDKLPKQKEGKYLKYSDDVCWAANLGKIHESIVSCGKDGVFMWNFVVEDEKIFVKETFEVKMNVEGDFLSRKVSWCANGNVFISVMEEKTVFLLKEMNNQWQIVYAFKKEEKRNFLD